MSFRFCRRLRRGHQLSGVPKRLIFVTLAATAAYVTQFALKHSDQAPDLSVSHWVGSMPAPIAGVVSVIDPRART